MGKNQLIISLSGNLKMTMSIQPADRLSHFSEYYFSIKLREIAQMRSEGRDVINLGIGSPDLDPDDGVVDELVSAAKESGVHGYQPYQGIQEFGAAITGFYQRHYKAIPMHCSVLPLMGSKEGITHISLAYLNPGDQVLIPSLGYPTYSSVTRMVGAVPVYFPLIADDQWAPDWEFLERLDCTKIKMMWINYPHMPTGAGASIELLSRLVDYAKRNGILLCHDNPYSFILNDYPLSIFNVAGAEDVSIELNSLSKTFNMAGWRVGWVLGRSELIKPVLQIKSNMDSGMFKPLQLAAIKALSSGNDWFLNLKLTYRKRQMVAFEILRSLECNFDEDQSGMFVWAKVPNGDGVTFTDRMLQDYNVFLTPGIIFGEAGKDYIRLSLCANEDLLLAVKKRLL